MKAVPTASLGLNDTQYLFEFYVELFDLQRTCAYETNILKAVLVQLQKIQALIDESSSGGCSCRKNSQPTFIDHPSIVYIFHYLNALPSKSSSKWPFIHTSEIVNGPPLCGFSIYPLI